MALCTAPALEEAGWLEGAEAPGAPCAHGSTPCDVVVRKITMAIERIDACTADQDGRKYSFRILNGAVAMSARESIERVANQDASTSYSAHPTYPPRSMGTRACALA